MTQKIEIDTLRGFACILLVLYHVVGNTPAVGLNIPEEHWLARGNAALAYLRMPLFTFISGYVYALRPYHGNATGFLKGKVRRLLLPLLTVGTAFAVLQAITPGTNAAVANWSRLHIDPVGHFWFLQALFIIFLTVLLLEQLNAISTLSRLAGVLVLSALLYLTLSPPNYFALSGAVDLLPFFLAGLACKRFEIGARPARFIAAMIFLSAAATAVLLPHYSALASSLPALALGISGAFLLLRSGWRSAALAYIGSFSFAIYLLHVFFTAGSRIAFKSIGLTEIFGLLTIGLFFGIAGPILAARAIGRYPVLNLWLLGSTPKKTSPSKLPPTAHPDSLKCPGYDPTTTKAQSPQPTNLTGTSQQ